MIFWSKKEHKLPKFPATIIPTFKALCECIPVDQIDELREAVEHNLESARKAHAEDPHVDIKTATKLSECSHYLLTRYDEFNDKQKALIVGAVRYSAIADDPFCDATFTTGFNDDMRIMNYVLEELGIHDMYFSLH